jgi:3-oxoacyl-[acyl-carrier-protein] synthase II
MPFAFEPVVITGLGAVSALGHGTAALWASIAAGRDGIRPIERFSTESFSVHIGGMVGDLVPREGADPYLDLAIEAAFEALVPRCVPGERLALVLGTSYREDQEGLHRLTERVGDAVGARGPRITISTACASSTNAIGLGKDLLDAGLADRVLAGGTDILVPEIFAGFHALGLLSASPCAPFGLPVGTTLGEGAGFVLLERESRARERGVAAPVLAGYALSSDAYHATSPDPSGAGVARAIRGALEDAGIGAESVDYLNAHGTGTAANDAAEWRAIETVFGDRAQRLPVSSTKSFLGHAQGAAGVLELAATLLAMQQGMIPPTLHLTRPRPRSPADPVAQSLPREHAVRHAVCTSSAFGGANAALVVSARHGAAPASSRSRRDVFVTGAAAVTTRPTSQRLAALLPTADTRGLDPSSRLITEAAARALADADTSVRGRARERAGIFFATTRVSAESASEFQTSIDQRGLSKLSATAFTRMVLNAPAGACSRLLGLRGPTTTLTTGEGSGLAALVYAAVSLAFRGDADLLLAGAVDESDDEEMASGRADAGACLVLSTSPSTGPRIRISGFGLAGPGALDEAIAHAREMAGPSGEEPTLAAPPMLRGAEASGALLACVSAVEALRRGDATTRLIVNAGGGSASSALILTTR